MCCPLVPTASPAAKVTMPTSAAGSKSPVHAARGFTLIELMVVVALIAIATAGVSLALRDSADSALERDAQRLAAVLEATRAQARARPAASPALAVRPDAGANHRPRRAGAGAADRASADRPVRCATAPASPLGGHRWSAAFRGAAHPTREPTMSGQAKARGFTLIEVLVALSIVAVALLAGLQATGALSNNAQRQTLTMLGQICAENKLIRLRLQRQFVLQLSTVMGRH